MFSRDELDEMAAAIGCLPNRQSQACLLRFGDVPPMPYRQIAQAMGNTPRAAYKLVHKGSHRLRAQGVNVSRLARQASAA